MPVAADQLLGGDDRLSRLFGELVLLHRVISC
jgi:hypothetical protein